jgi:hypothetical protein
MNFSLQGRGVFRMRSAAEFEYWYYIQYLPVTARPRLIRIKTAQRSKTPPNMAKGP